jgi:tagatose-1,6-bisphosphate aldolase non-catalytic subunit AgaZ/GatZ
MIFSLPKKINFHKNIILGGQHLGVNIWQNESAESTMQKFALMMRNYMQAVLV